MDDPQESSSEILFVPPCDAARAQDLKLMLPQMPLPDEESIPCAICRSSTVFIAPKTLKSPWAG